MWVSFQSLLSCAFCEQEGHLATPFSVSLSAPVQAGYTGVHVGVVGKTILPLEDLAEK